MRIQPAINGRGMILHGDALTVLRRDIDAESVNCVITSPPYWGLRSYNTPDMIWDAKEGCEHEWVEGIKGGISGGTKSEKVQIKNQENFQITPDSKHAFCIRCSAWRGSLGLEPTYYLYLQHLMQIFDEVKRVLRKDGCCFVNIGDTYGGNSTNRNMVSGNPEFNEGHPCREKVILPMRNSEVPSKSLIGIPERFAIMMTDAGWIRRNTVVWWKRNCMPSSARDRFTVDFEPVYFFVKSGKYWFERQFEAQIDWGTRDRHNGKYFNVSLHSEKGLTGNINPLGRNRRCVWDIPTQSFSDAHFATFPEKLVEPMIKAGCPEGGIVMDPFAGAGTVGVVAKRLRRSFIGIELNPAYIEMAERRIERTPEDNQLRLGIEWAT